MQKLNYDELSSDLEDWAGICSSSEIHGLVAGLGSVALAGKFKLVKDIVLRHLEEDDCAPHITAVIQVLQESVIAQFEDPEFGFAPLLPDDDEELSLRIGALAQWCQGFLVGFGTGVKTAEVNFSQDTQEVLRDLVEISNVADDLDQEANEANEIAYTELEEYVRAAAMMLYSEFGVADPQPAKGQGDTHQAKPNSESQTYH